VAVTDGHQARLRKCEYRMRKWVVFNIKGGKYRLVHVLNYQYQICHIRFVGTHQAYDRINVSRV
jgi:mRNA-degrading endonuclease HigB of HigAB toxin-antitoxin module